VPQEQALARGLAVEEAVPPGEAQEVRRREPAVARRDAPEGR